MSERNWAMISNGATFESLVRTLIFFNDSGAALFGRTGADGGQDVLSGDRTTVYQCKFHQDESVAKAISDAKKEAAKLAKYRATDHPRSQQWSKVANWYLVTNAKFNPSDLEKWKKEVVPLFLNQGLSPHYWEQSNLDALLDKYKEVDRSFFANENRVFLTLPETLEKLRLEDPFILGETLSSFVGRKTEIEKAVSFLKSDKVFLVVHGAGGVGKSRLLVEFGERIGEIGDWQVLWANVASMSYSTSWLDAIIPERPTLLIVDEPDEPSILKVLAEQIGVKTGRNSKWKIAVSVRSPKDPVIRFLTNAKVSPRVEMLPLNKLDFESALKLCKSLIVATQPSIEPVDWIDTISNEIVTRFSSNPIWISLAVHAFITTGSILGIPNSAKDLAEMYLSEIVNGDKAKLETLRIVALIGVFNRADAAAMGLLKKYTSHPEEHISELVAKRALIERGANRRLVEIKPDLIRDFILMNWLSKNIGYGPTPIVPSDDTNHLIEKLSQSILNGNSNAIDKATLQAISRTEILLNFSDQNINLLDPLLQSVIDGILLGQPSVRLAAIESFIVIANHRPIEILQLSKLLRKNSVNSQTISTLFGSRIIGQHTILLALPWLVFHAAMGAQSRNLQIEIILELMELAAIESEIKENIPSTVDKDGKRASELIRRVVMSGEGFASDYEIATQKVIAELFAKFKIHSIPYHFMLGLKSLLTAASAQERSDIFYEGNSVVHRTYRISLEDAAWNTRKAALSFIKDMLENSNREIKEHIIFWDIFSEAHGNTTRARIGNPKSILNEEIEDLTWALGVISSRPKINLAELFSARNLWIWHIQFEVHPELKLASEVLEKKFLENQIAQEFTPLLSFDEEWEQREQRITLKAQELSLLSVEAIGQFVQRAIIYLQNATEVHHLDSIATPLGKLASTHPNVSEFVKYTLKNSDITAHIEFAISVAQSWISYVRQEKEGLAFELIQELELICKLPETQVKFCYQCYSYFSREGIIKLEPNERDYLYKHLQIFLHLKKNALFAKSIGWTVLSGWENYRDTVNALIESTPIDELNYVLAELLTSITSLITKGQKIRFPDQFGNWLFDHFIKIPSFDSFGHLNEWHLKKIFDFLGGASISHLVSGLSLRMQREMNGINSGIKMPAIGGRFMLSQFCTQLTKNNATEWTYVDQLIDMAVSKASSLRFYMPKILRDIDSHGNLVPHVVARRLEKNVADNEAIFLARVTGIYEKGSSPWRIAAKPLMEYAQKCSDREKYGIYQEISGTGIRSWSSLVGEVPQLFIDAETYASEANSSEEEEIFRPFFEWSLKVAQSELLEQEEQAKEARGE